MQGVRALSRQEIDFPVQLGFVKAVPYALGELGYWGEDLNGQPLSRAYGQVGVRADLPMWTSIPPWKARSGTSTASPIRSISMWKRWRPKRTSP